MALSLGNKPVDSFNKPVSFSVKVNGSVIDTKYTFIKINVDKCINKLSRAKIYISGGDANKNEFEQIESVNFNPGKTVEISLGYDQDNDTVFEGIIEKIGISLGDGYTTKPWKSLMVVECVDKAIKLTNSYTSDLYEDKKESEIFSTLIRKVSGLTSSITSTSVTHDFFPKHNSSDWDFIINRSRLNGMVVINSDNKIEICEPYKSVFLPDLTITNGKSTISFDAQINAANQLNGITYSSWDPFTDKSVQNNGSEPSLVANSQLTGKTLSSSTSASSIEINIPQSTDASELKVLSDAKLMESRLGRITGRAKFKGVSNIKIGSIVSLSGFGKYLDGKIYVTGVSHQLESGFYTTEIKFGLKKDIFHNKNKSSIDRNDVFENINGIQIGVVKAIDKDPLNQGRIQVLIPYLKDTGNGIWAQLSQYYTSSEAGVFFYPEIGTQVIVSFIANDPRYPVVIGSLYTKTKTSYKKITKENSFKAILTQSKLTLEFDDKDKIITISTPEKNSIVISEKDKGIIITDQNKNTITTSDKGIAIESKKDIDLKASGSITISGTKGVTLDGKSGDGIKATGSKVSITSKSALTLKGGSKADLTASGKITVKGASVGIN